MDEKQLFYLYYFFNIYDTRYIIEEIIPNTHFNTYQFQIGLFEFIRFNMLDICLKFDKKYTEFFLSPNKMRTLQ
eukprot:snap_masked-scaffold_5-processed-gene-7.39-mRNA-1 protein AED:1.00 eAED:1.00 QI:0/0/0/0/1/1/2/0/73